LNTTKTTTTTTTTATATATTTTKSGYLIYHAQCIYYLGGFVKYPLYPIAVICLTFEVLSTKILEVFS